MIKNKEKLILTIIYIFLILFGVYFLCKISFFNEYPLILKIIYIFMILIVLQYIIYIITKAKLLEINHYLGLLCYAIFLLITLYFRKSLKVETLDDSFYLDKWIKILFVNRIVFVNVIGNILIFIPFGIFFKQFIMPLKIKLLLMLIIIVLLELIQYVTKKGVFDYTDIVLNILGTFIGYIFTKKIKEEKHYEKSSIK